MGRLGRIFSNWRRVPEIVSAIQRSPEWLWLIIRYMKLGESTFPRTVSTRNGPKVTLHDDGEVAVFWNIFIRRCYNVPPDARVIVDLGANIGLFSLYAATRAPGARIVAVEPSPETFLRLNKHMDQYHLADRVQQLQLGVAGETGDRLFHDEGQSEQRHLMAAPGNTQAASADKVVRCLSFSDLLKQANLDVVDLLKIDIEGSEWEVLMSTPPQTLEKVRRLQFEYHAVDPRLGHSPERLFEHLGKAGLRLIHREEDPYGTGMAEFART